MKHTASLLRYCVLFAVMFIESCGCARDCPVGWQPHAFSPVFYGYRDYAESATAPGNCRVFYPSTDGSPQNAPPLEGCCKYPLVILIHGHCQGHEADEYKKWFLLPAQLARSGYVVLIPSVTLIAGTPSTNHPAIPVIESFRDWVLNDWEFHELVDPNTGIIGHSFGAPIGSSISKTNNAVRAFVSLSGQYEGVNDYLSMNKPVLFLRGHPTSDIAETYVGFNWSATPSPKHKVEFAEGYHWDYLLPSQVQCSNCFGHGDCSKSAQLSTEVITMFFSRYLRRTNTVDNRVPLSLIPPDITLTTEQQFYAGGGYLSAFDNPGRNCMVNLEWVTPQGSGTTHRP